MKKRLLISLVLALLLTTLMPATVSAAKPPPLVDFNTSGYIDGISPGKVIEAGATGKWVVVERELTGYLSGDISGAFTMNYHAMVESVYTQAGDLQGWLTIDEGAYVLRVKGTIDPLVGPVGYVEIPFPPYIAPVYYLEINGTWQFTNGIRGNGGYNAGVYFIPTPDLHVGSIVGSWFEMTGKWQP